MDTKSQDRFWAKVAKGDGCWVWTASCTEHGYGQFYNSADRSLARAHRVAWELTNGPIPAGLFVCHHCDNPPCVRPDHLFLGTRSDNMRDASSKGRLPHLQGVSRPGTLNGSAKLSEEIVREIRVSPISNPKLAKFYGVSTTAVRFARVRKTWAHVA